MTPIEPSKKLALWLPGWYEMDQPLRVTQRVNLWFYRIPPADIPNVEDFDFIFFNQLSAPDNCQVREATVVSIEHHQLGPMREVETQGLDYVFFTTSGETIVVNAEENPGSTQPPTLNINDWSLRVILEDVSDPVTDPT